MQNAFLNSGQSSWVPYKMRKLPALLFYLFASASASVQVQTGSGKLVGSSQQFHGLRRNGTYFSFQGIPYAAPPIVSLRFRDPVPVEHWSGVLDVSSGPPPVCPQMDSGVFVGDENCLFLNIFTPEVPSSRRELNSVLRPVVFWIHGGYFTFGAGAWGGPDLFLESDVVFVSLNYRLGVLGFMAIEGTSIQGNMGLKDQLEAMRWIKKNIAQFGGDPSRITIMGGSAGGASVHSHLLSPLGKGEDLFHRAIAMSGTAMLWDPEKSNEFVESSSRKTYQLLCGGILEMKQPSENMTETCLYGLSAGEMTDKLFNLYVNRNRNETVTESLSDSFSDNLFFGPILDPWADIPFQPEHPVTVVTSQEQKMVPFMTGVTKDEGALFLAPLWKDMKPKNNQLQKNWKLFGPIQFNHRLNKESVTNDDSLYADVIARFYVGKNGIKRENKQDLLDMFSDEHFVMPNNEFVKLHAKSPAPVYNYQFSYRGSYSFSTMFSMGGRKAMKEDFGVSHLDDRLYMFRFPSILHLVSDQDIKVAEIFQKLLTNFARYGDPTPIVYRDIPNWPKAQTTPNSCVYFDINDNPHERHAMHPGRMKFWNQIYFKSVLDRYVIFEDDQEEFNDDENDDYDMEADVGVENVRENDEEFCNCKRKYRKTRKERKERRAKKRLNRRGRRDRNSIYNRMNKISYTKNNYGWGWGR